MNKKAIVTILSLTALIFSLMSSVQALVMIDSEPVGNREYFQLVQGKNAAYNVSLNPSDAELIGPPTGAELAKLEANFTQPVWSFTVGWFNHTTGKIEPGLQTPGTYEVLQYDAAVGEPWTPTNDFGVIYRVPLDQAVHVEWIQFVHTNLPAGNETSPYVDPTWWNGVRDFEDGRPFYWTEIENNNMTTFTGDEMMFGFTDRPLRGVADAPAFWEANLYLAIALYDPVQGEWDVGIASQGIRWGFNITVVGAGAPTGGTYKYGGVGGDKFENVSFNPLDEGYLVEDLEIHDIAVTGVSPYKTVIGQGYSMTFDAVDENQGNFTEAFNVITYANYSAANTQSLNLTAGATETRNFTWNTSGFVYGNYTLIGAADVVPGETDIADNNYTCSVPVHVGVPGDVSGPTIGAYDKTCNMRDISYLIQLFNTNPSSPNWKPNADINNDGTVNMRDIQIAIINFNQHE